MFPFFFCFNVWGHRSVSFTPFTQITTHPSNPRLVGYLLTSHINHACFKFILPCMHQIYFTMHALKSFLTMKSLNEGWVGILAILPVYIWYPSRSVSSFDILGIQKSERVQIDTHPNLFQSCKYPIWMWIQVVINKNDTSSINFVQNIYKQSGSEYI